MKKKIATTQRYRLPFYIIVLILLMKIYNVFYIGLFLISTVAAALSILTASFLMGRASPVPIAKEGENECVTR